jgi:hypothetical protein
MPLARIRTQFPDEVEELCGALIEAGYVVETVRPEDFRIVPADLELTVDKLPAVEAWQHIPDSEVLYVAPGTPESRDIRSSMSPDVSREAAFNRALADMREGVLVARRWAATQSRELRAHGHEIPARMHELRRWANKIGVQAQELRVRMNELRRRWTPPREYHGPPHLEPVAPSTVSTVRIDETLRKSQALQEEQEKQRAAAERELARQAHLAAESRRRAREAEEAKVLLEQQRKIEAMVQSTETLRERVLHPAPAGAPEQPRRRPRHLLRSRRERAFLRAGVVAFSASVGLALLTAQALHPRPARTAIPHAAAASVPFSKSPGIVPVNVPENASTKPPSAVPTFAKEGMIAIAAERKPARARHEDAVAEDEVIVRKPAVARSNPPKTKSGIVHYSDLD